MIIYKETIFFFFRRRTEFVVRPRRGRNREEWREHLTRGPCRPWNVGRKVSPFTSRWPFRIKSRLSSTETSSSSRTHSRLTDSAQEPLVSRGARRLHASGVHEKCSRARAALKSLGNCTCAGQVWSIENLKGLRAALIHRRERKGRPRETATAKNRKSCHAKTQLRERSIATSIVPLKIYNKNIRKYLALFLCASIFFCVSTDPIFLIILIHTVRTSNVNNDDDDNEDEPVYRGTVIQQQSAMKNRASYASRD